MKRFGILLLVLFVSCAANAQIRVDTVMKTSHSFFPVISPAQSPSFRSLLPPQPVISNNFYAQHLPFFCRQELKMQDAHIPLAIRVGRIEDCNWLEQKPGYIYRP
jgi:hypothetical protein